MIELRIGLLTDAGVWHKLNLSIVYDKEEAL